MTVKIDRQVTVTVDGKLTATQNANGDWDLPYRAAWTRDDLLRLRECVVVILDSTELNEPEPVPESEATHG